MVGHFRPLVGLPTPSIYPDTPPQTGFFLLDVCHRVAAQSKNTTSGGRLWTAVACQTKPNFV